MYPENYYTDMNTVESGLRKPAALSESLIPIPTADLYKQILKKHKNNNEKFVEELEVKSLNFEINKYDSKNYILFLNEIKKLLSANYIKMNVSDAKEKEQTKNLFWHEKVTKSLIDNENVEFCYEV